MLAASARAALPAYLQHICSSNQGQVFLLGTTALQSDWWPLRRQLRHRTWPRLGVRDPPDGNAITSSHPLSLTHSRTHSPDLLSSNRSISPPVTLASSRELDFEITSLVSLLLSAWIGVSGGRGAAASALFPASCLSAHNRRSSAQLT